MKTEDRERKPRSLIKESFKAGRHTLREKRSILSVIMPRGFEDRGSRKRGKKRYLLQKARQGCSGGGR